MFYSYTHTDHRGDGRRIHYSRDKNIADARILIHEHDIERRPLAGLYVRLPNEMLLQFAQVINNPIAQAMDRISKAIGVPDETISCDDIAAAIEEWAVTGKKPNWVTATAKIEGEPNE